eukprot:2159634-Pyramimonas_sp.AAC.2
MTDGVMMGLMTTIFATLFSFYQTKAFMAAGALSALGCVGALVLSQIWDGKQLEMNDTTAADSGPETIDVSPTAVV